MEQEAIAILLILDEASAIAELWVPNGTPEAAVRRMIQSHAGQYRVAVFRSGSADLTALTSDLLNMQKP